MCIRDSSCTSQRDHDEGNEIVQRNKRPMGIQLNTISYTDERPNFKLGFPSRGSSVKINHGTVQRSLTWEQVLKLGRKLGCMENYSQVTWPYFLFEFERQRHKSMSSLVEWDTRAARFLVQFFDIVSKTTTWIFHVWGCDDNASPQR